jgi:hypothetical protein
VGGVAPPRRCVLAGDHAALQIPDFVAFKHQMRLSGQLTVAAGGFERAIAFQAGDVRGARSRDPFEQLGEVIVRLGYATREQVAAAAAGLDGPEPPQRTVGKALVERGVLTPPQLLKCVEEHVVAIFHSILTAREGVFHLVDPPDIEADAPLSLETYGLLMDGIRRIDELGLFTSRIPGPHAFVQRRAPRAGRALEPAEHAVLELIDGPRRVSDLARAAHLSEFEALKTLYHLAEVGCVEVVEGPAVAAAHSPLVTEIARAANAALRQVAIAAARAGALEALVEDGRAFLADPGSRFAPLFRRVALGGDGAIDDAALLGNLAALKEVPLRRLEPSGDAARYLRDGLRELLFFQLYRVGERLDRGADEALADEVRRRLEPAGGLG